MSNDFYRGGAPARILLAWWMGLADDRASRAILKRAESVTAVVLSAPYQRLHRQMRAAGWNPNGWERLDDRLAAAVGLLAHVKENVSGALPKTMSRTEPGGRPPVSEARFLRLLESADLEDLFRGLRRILPLIKYRVDVLDLVEDVLGWGDDVKKRWAYHYDWPAKAAV